MTIAKPQMLLAVLALVTLSACTSASTVTVSAPTTTTSRAATTPPTTRPSPTTTSARPSTTKPKPTTDSKLVQAVAIANWWNDGGKGLMTDITDEENAITAAASEYDLESLVEHCSALGTAANEADDYGPIPAASVQGEWSQALSYLKHAASACTDGDLAGSARFITLAGTHMNAATSALQEFVQ